MLSRFNVVLAAVLVIGCGQHLAVAAVEEGQPAPDIDLPATQIEKSIPGAKDAKTLKLKDLEGKKNVVLFFYPKALTGGWTREACGFRDLAEQFAQLDTVIIGISTDPLSLQKKFSDKENLNFSLFADADKKATQAFGVLRGSGTANRVTFVIDKKGVVRKVYSKVNPATHPKEVLDYVKKELAK